MSENEGLDINAALDSAVQSVPEGQRQKLLTHLKREMAKSIDTAVSAFSQENTEEFQTLLRNEFNGRLAQLPQGDVFQISALKREFRARGLEVM